MNLEQRINAFTALGKSVTKLVLDKPAKANSWFTSENLALASQGIKKMLSHENLNHWVAIYPKLAEEIEPKNIAVIMAGNIPLVGFHDFLSVLISGHNFIGKLSSKDEKLLPLLANKLIEIEPEFKEKIAFTEDRLSNFDAVIATGSNNSARYFDYYFGKYPNLIRKNRHSVAVLTGNETKADLENLAHDIFSYFGMGCRNVSKLYLPKGFDLQSIFPPMMNYEKIINHNKYANNYDYHRAIFLMNLTKFWDNGFITLTESEALGAPVSVLFFEYYEAIEPLKIKLKEQKKQLQCVVALPGIIKKSIAFGQTQQPELWDYADNTDTIEFLLSV